MHKPAFIMILLTAPLAAQEIDATPGATLATLKADFNTNGTPDEATLFRRREGDSSDVSLEIREDGAAEPSAYAPVVGWAGVMHGQQPELAVLPNGSLRVTSMNEAIGRNRWYMSVTITKRKGRWLIAGITYEWRDTIDPDSHGMCDINLLSGRGIFKKADGAQMQLRHGLQAMEIGEWDGSLPEACGSRD